MKVLHYYNHNYKKRQKLNDKILEALNNLKTFSNGCWIGSDKKSEGYSLICNELKTIIESIKYGSKKLDILKGPTSYVLGDNDNQLISDDEELRHHLRERTTNALEKEGIVTIEDIKKVTYDTLFRTPNLGIKSVKEIYNFLESNNIHLSCGPERYKILRKYINKEKEKQIEY